MVHRVWPQATSNIQNIFQGNSVLSLLECEYRMEWHYCYHLHSHQLFVHILEIVLFFFPWVWPNSTAPKTVCIFLIFFLLDFSIVILPLIVCPGEKVNRSENFYSCRWCWSKLQWSNSNIQIRNILLCEGDESPFYIDVFLVFYGKSFLHRYYKNNHLMR